MQVYKRIENGSENFITIKDGLDEINHAMMAGQREVRTMSAGRGDAWITYKDGRRVILLRVDAPEPEIEAAESEPCEWAGTRSRFNNLHRFSEKNRARCNSNIWPLVCAKESDPVYQTRSEVEASEYAHLYTFCPKCSAL